MSTPDPLSPFSSPAPLCPEPRPVGHRRRHARPGEAAPPHRGPPRPGRHGNTTSAPVPLTMVWRPAAVPGYLERRLPGARSGRSQTEAPAP